MGLFTLPVVLGSVAGAAAIIIGLIWLVISKGEGFDKLPNFQKVWILVAIGFFVLFALSEVSANSIKFGFNTIGFVLAVGVYLRFRKFSKSQMWLSVLIGFAVFGLLLGMSWAIYEHINLAKFRITPIVGGGANLMARVAVLLALFVSCIVLLDGKTLQKFSVYVIALFAAGLIVTYSGSRGAMLAMPLLLAAPIFSVMAAKKGTWLPLCGAFFICSCLISGLVYWLNPNELVSSTLDRLQSIANATSMDRSTELRYQMWQVAFRSFLEHPIFGLGWHSFIEVTRNTVLAEYAAENRFFNFHSDIANFAVAGGIFGLLFYFLLLFSPLIFWETPIEHPYFRLRLYWAVTMPILYIVLGLTDMVIGFDYPTMFYAFSFAIIWSLTEKKDGMGV